MAPSAHIFGSLVIREWHYLKGIRRGGLVGVDMSYWRKHVTEGEGFGDSKAQTRPSLPLFLLLVGSDVELSAASSAPCLPERCHASCHDVNGLNL